VIERQPPPTRNHSPAQSVFQFQCGVDDGQGGAVHPAVVVRAGLRRGQRLGDRREKRDGRSFCLFDGPVERITELGQHVLVDVQFLQQRVERGTVPFSSPTIRSGWWSAEKLGQSPTVLR
jgi:hypothetical protein